MKEGIDRKNKEIQKILTEKKYLEIIFTCASIIVFLIGLIESIIARNADILFCTVLISIIFLVVMKLRLNFEVTRELDAIKSRDE